jgi:sucrose-6-phosphate hydrolase SacC (GH32 family)
VEWFLGKIERHRFIAKANGILAEGSYASQVVYDERGKPIHLAWVNTGDRKGWNGFCTLPCTLKVADGKLLRNPIAALGNLRGEVRRLSPKLGPAISLEPAMSGSHAEYSLVLDPQLAKRISITFKDAGDTSKSVSITYDSVAGRLRVGDHAAELNLSSGHKLQLKLYFDGISLEAFANGGEVTFSTLTPFSDRPITGELQADQPVRLEKFESYGLRPAQFDLKRFVASGPTHN